MIPTLVLLAHFDQFGEFVMALFKQNVYVSPSLGDGINGAVVVFGHTVTADERVNDNMADLVLPDESN